MAFDIETYSKDDMFTLPENEDDVVYQIGITLKNYSDKQARRILLHLLNDGKGKISNFNFIQVEQRMFQNVIFAQGMQKIQQNCVKTSCVWKKDTLYQR